MPERPLLKLPIPNEIIPSSRSFYLNDPVRGLTPQRQAQRLGRVFDRLDQVLPDPDKLADLRDDPSAIVPERALVFEVAGTLSDFYRSASRIPGLEFLGEDEKEIVADEDFAVFDKDIRKDEKLVPARLYFTIPDTQALKELVRLWKLFSAGASLGRGYKPWMDVFAHLVDVRPWGPKDRLSEETLADWSRRIADDPDVPVPVEVEFWYREDKDRRRRVEADFIAEIKALGGVLLESTDIGPIRYHAALVKVPPNVVEKIIEHPDVSLAKHEETMFLRSQSLVGEPCAETESFPGEEANRPVPDELNPPVAALLDGVPMTGHDRLAGRLDLDDPEDFADEYGSAGEQRHGTGMASLIVHGDLNAPTTIRSLLHVRPLMKPRPDGMGRQEEYMPTDRLGVDLMWRAFLRMKEGEGESPATAPSVRIVNISLGDRNRRFAGVMSPWARLLDHLAWEYGLLIMVSAGNVPDALCLPPEISFTTVDDMEPEPRRELVLRTLLFERANRRLCSPAEAVNVLTVGACHHDDAPRRPDQSMIFDPYKGSHLPNPSSSMGLGLRRAVKPEILFSGGRELLQIAPAGSTVELKPAGSPNRSFGIKAAAPSSSGGHTGYVDLQNGTSVATALATHAAVRIYESLPETPEEPVYPAPENHFIPVVLKALLVHSARWNDEEMKVLETVLKPDDGSKLHHEHLKDELTRFFGYGRADVDRVLDCAAGRATLVGWGSLEKMKSHRYRAPLPPGIQGIRGFRSVTVTVAWMTPVNLRHRGYRRAKLTVEPGGDKQFSLGVDNAKVQPSHTAVARGTVFHRRWEGDKAVAFVDGGDLVFDVSCKASAGELDDAVRYGVALSIEVGQDVSVEVYEQVREKLRAGVQVPALQVPV